MRLALLAPLIIALALGVAPLPAHAQSVDDELTLLRSRLEALENDFGTLLRAHQELVKLQQDQRQDLTKAQEELRKARESQATQTSTRLSAADQQALVQTERTSQAAAQTAQEAATASQEAADALASLRTELIALTDETKSALADATRQAAESASEAQEILAAIREAQQTEPQTADTESEAETSEARSTLANSNSPEVRLLLGRLEELEGLQRATTGSLEQLEYRLRTLEQALQSAFSAAPPDSGVQSEALDEFSSSALTPEQAGEDTTSTVQTLGEVSDSSLQQATREAAASASVSLATLAPSETVETASPRAAATPQEQYAIAFALLRSNQYAEAESELRTFLEQWPEDALADNARYWLGETLYVRKEYQAAARVFAEGLDRAPDGAKAPDNLLKLGLSFSSLGDNEKACQVLLSLATRYVEAPETILRRGEAERNRLACP